MSLPSRLSKVKCVMFVDDERELGNGIIVMLKEGYEFINDPGCGTRGFDSYIEALFEVRNLTRLKDKGGAP